MHKLVVTEVALVARVVVTVEERKKVVVTVVTGVTAILRLQQLCYQGCVILLYLRRVFLFLGVVAVNFDFGEARRCDGG